MIPFTVINRRHFLYFHFNNFVKKSGSGNAAPGSICMVVVWSNPGRFGLESFRLGRFGLGRFGQFLGWVVSALIGGSFRPIFGVWTRSGRNQHSLAFQIPSASKDVYKYSFFPQTIRDWNDLLNPLFLPLNCKMHNDGVSKFTSLVSARD